MPNKNRTLVKLDDEVIEIVKGKKGLLAKKLTDDDLLEVSLLDEGVEKLLENDINKLVNETYDELKKSFKNTLAANVLKVVGFDNRWGGISGWEVDHCNGRSSQITSYMSGKVQQMFTQEFDELLQPEIENLVKPLRKVILKEFEQQFKERARRQMYEYTDKAAKAFLEDLVDKTLKKHQRKLTEKAELAFLGRNIKNEDELDDK
jgi:predicted metal-dependent hydrolase